MKRGGRLERRTPLKSTTRLERRTGLRAKTGLANATPIKPVSSKRRAENRERRTVIKATFGDAPCCIAPGCGRLADDIHEPLTRARGGSITDPANMVPLCRGCHDLVQLGPPWAYELGLMVHSWPSGDAA